MYGQSRGVRILIVGRGHESTLLMWNASVALKNRAAQNNRKVNADTP